MKKHLLIILIFLSVGLKIFGQNYYEISFEGTGVNEYDYHHKLYIDTTLNPNNIWQIGHPNKTVFISGAPNPNAIVTDTLNPYPINDTSSFILQHIANFGFSMPCNVTFGGKYFVNSDTLSDYGRIEFSPNKGITWIDLVTNTTYSNSIQWNNPWIKPTLTGNSNGWKEFRVDIAGLGPIFNIQYRDTVMWRFTFISNGVQTNKDGLMFDSIYVWDTPPINVEYINSKNIQIKTYPNPTSDQFFIEANTADKLNVDLYDVSGKHVFSANVSDKSNINVTSLNEGAYTMTIKTVDRVINKKIVILR